MCIRDRHISASANVCHDLAALAESHLGRKREVGTARV